MERLVSVDVIEPGTGPIIGDLVPAIRGMPLIKVVIVDNADVPRASILNATSATAIKVPRLHGLNVVKKAPAAYALAKKKKRKI